MRIQFYLDEKSRRKVAREILNARKDEKWSSLGLSLHHRADGAYFNEDEEGIYTSTDSFFGGTPRRIKNLPFRLITLYDEALETPLTEGEYKNGEATAIVDHFTKKVGNGWDEQILNVWRIRIRAENLAAAEHLYRDIRTRRIQPTEAWGKLLLPLEQPLLEITLTDIQPSEEGGTQETKSA